VAKFDINSAEGQELVEKLAKEVIEAGEWQNMREGENIVLSLSGAGYEVPQDKKARNEFGHKMMALREAVQARVEEVVNAPIYGEEKPDSHKVPLTFQINTTPEAVTSPKLTPYFGGLNLKKWAVAAGLLGFVLTEVSCKKNYVDLEVPVPCQDCYTDHIKIGSTGVFYGPSNALTVAQASALGVYKDGVIFNAGEHSQADLHGAPGISYFSPVTLGGGDLGTNAIYKKIKEIDSIGLAAGDPSKYGFIRDASGNTLKSTFNGTSPVINYLNPEVQKILHDFGVKKIKEGNDGAVVDETDIWLYYIDLANQGLTQTQPNIANSVETIANLYHGIATDYVKYSKDTLKEKDPSKGLSLLSGIQPGKFLPIPISDPNKLTELAAQIWRKAPSCRLILESRAYAEPGVPQNVDYEKTVFQQLGDVAKLRQDLTAGPDGYPVLTIWMMEPAIRQGNSFDYKTPAVGTAEWCNRAMQHIHSVAPNVKVHFKINIIPTLAPDYKFFDHQNRDVFPENFKLKTDSTLKNLGVTFNDYKVPVPVLDYKLLPEKENGKQDAQMYAKQEMQTRTMMEMTFDPLKKSVEDATRGANAADAMMAQTKSFKEKLGRDDGSAAAEITAKLKAGYTAQRKAEKAEAAGKQNGIA
jgi:hypothetical protein